MMQRSLVQTALFAGLCGIWLIHLGLYVWLVPPWQHYDEPTHFEYAALIREQGRLPTLEEHVPELRRAIAQSMIDEGFYKQSNANIPTPTAATSDAEIGINERNHPPLYYALVALATLPVRDAPMLTQLYVARCVSVALALLLFVAANAVLQLLLAERWLLRYAVLAALVLAPAFVDSMTAVNSDALANCVAVVVLLVALLVQRHPSWKMALLSVLVMVLAWNVKRTLLVYTMLIPLAWFFVAPVVIKRVGAAIALGGAGIVTIVLLAVPWPLADWNGSPNALIARAAPADGRNAFVLHQNESLVQEVYPYRMRDVLGQRLTLVARMRSDVPLRSTSPLLLVDAQAVSIPVDLTSSWRTITLTTDLPLATRLLSIRLDGNAGGSVYYDSLALVAGNESIPSPTEPDGAFAAGVATPNAPANLLRNVGAERRVPPVATLRMRLTGGDVANYTLEQTLSTSANWRWIMAVYPRQLWLLFSGAWGIFGWGQYAVSAGWFVPLALLALGSILGTLLQAWRVWRSPGCFEPWRIRGWLLAGIALLLGWGVALLRVHIQPFPGVMFWSFGRYTFVAMLPFMLFFVVGLHALVPRNFRPQVTAAQIMFLAIFALIGLAALRPPA